jgi:hypothetical protein
VIAQIIEVHQVELGRAAARPCFWTAIADAAAGVDAALPGDRSGTKKKGLSKAGFASPTRPDERHGSGFSRSFGHDRLLRLRWSSPVKETRMLAPVSRRSNALPVDCSGQEYARATG